MINESIEERVRAEQVRLLFDQGAAAFIINGLVAAALAILVGQHVPRASLVAWCAFFAVAWAIRGALHLAHRLHPEALSGDAWLRLFSVGALLSGATWGLTALWLFPTSVGDRFLVSVAIMGLASGAAASLSCVRGIYPLYLFPAFLPVAIRFAFDSGSNPYIISALSILYCVGMSYAANLNYRQLADSLRLRFQNAELASNLEKLATHDALTGLANRRLLMERLDSALRRARRLQAALAIVFIDCDDFKGINDAQGHDAGDRFLKEVAASLLSAVREVDTVARVGGDEFIVLLENVSDQVALDRVVRRMAVVPRLSIGVARFPADGIDGEALVRAADKAMYAAKQAGGNRVTFAST